jgi:hypothetical protein
MSVACCVPPLRHRARRDRQAAERARAARPVANHRRATPGSDQRLGRGTVAALRLSMDLASEPSLHLEGFGLMPCS